MEAPSHTTHYLIIRIYSGLAEGNMLPSINYSYVQPEERVFNGRIYINYHDLGDMQFNIPFKEFALRSDLDVSEMLEYARVHCDTERLAEEMQKAGFSYRELMAIAQHMHKEAA